MTDPTLTGRTVGGAYRITGFQRPGRMGDIYVGRRIENNDIVSIKMLDPAMFGEQEAVRRFERETRITKRLNHPCSLNVLDYGHTDDGLPYMVTEYVEGDLLSDVIEEAGRLPPERAAYLAAQIAMALDAAHQIGVIHRDLAPSNILVTEAEGQSDSVKVIEFGLSRLQEGDEGDGSALTAVGVRIGTPYYMAPEYIEEYALDHRADLYALGIVLFEMLTGSPPFTGRPYKVMDRHLHEEPPAPSSVAPDVPPWLDALVADLLRKRPDDRPRTAAEVVQRIEEGLGERLATVSAPNVATPVQEKREAAPTSTDPVLQAFIDAQVERVERGSGAVDPAASLLVHRVAADGIAASVGVEEGMLCSLPDEPVNGMRDPALWMVPVDRRRYLFATRDGSRRIELTCTGAEIGVSFIRAAEHVAAHHDPAHSDNAALLELWLQGDWATLRDLTAAVLTRPPGALGMLNTGLFARFLGRGRGQGDAAPETFKHREHPALVLHGAALVELGDAGRGMDLIREYALDHAHRFPARYNGVATYYEALERASVGDADSAVDLLVQSWWMWPNRRVEEKVRELTGKIPDHRAWYGRQFPDYTLDVVGQRGKTRNLYQTLSRLGDHQVWLVILMGGERANAEYEQVMRRYLAYSAHFGEFLAGVHVVTDVPDRDPALEGWLAAEDEVLAQGRPVQVLEDYRGFLRRAIKPVAAPVVYGLSRRGYTVHEGALEPVELWDMLADALRLRKVGGAVG